MACWGDREYVGLYGDDVERAREIYIYIYTYEESHNPQKYKKDL